MITAGVMNGWSPSVITTASASGSAAIPRRSEKPCPRAQSAQTTVCAGPKSIRRGDLVGVVAEHDDDPVERSVHRVDGVLEQRLPAQVRQLLGLGAEARTGAGREDQPRGVHCVPSSIRSASVSSDAIELPGSRRSTCGIAAFMPRVSGS